jgi:hypothetical protein
MVPSTAEIAQEIFKIGGQPFVDNILEVVHAGNIDYLRPFLVFGSNAQIFLFK